MCVCVCVYVWEEGVEAMMERFFEAGRLLTLFGLQGGRLFEVGAYSRLALLEYILYVHIIILQGCLADKMHCDYDNKG